MSKLRVVGRVRETSVDPKCTNEVDQFVGQRLRLRRTMLSLGQEELADAIGVTYQQVQKYERGETRLTVSRLYDIAFVLGVPFEWFLDGLSDLHGPFGLSFPNSLPDIDIERDLRDLIRLFSSVENPKARRRFINLARALTDDDQLER